MLLLVYCAGPVLTSLILNVLKSYHHLLLWKLANSVLPEHVAAWMQVSVWLVIGGLFQMVVQCCSHRKSMHSYWVQLYLQPDMRWGSALTVPSVETLTLDLTASAVTSGLSVGLTPSLSAQYATKSLNINTIWCCTCGHTKTDKVSEEINSIRMFGEVIQRVI